ncbi:MAG TPA: CBS domain-containing protein [Nitrosopumilaceae archaeon]|nr:CBS domain-containing protein [Nitrosopumilaceae archaeon]
MISDTIYEHLKDIYNKKINSLIEPVTTIEPTLSVSKVINKLSKNDSYDAFYHDGKSVLTINVRSLLAGKDIADMKVHPFLETIPALTPTDNIQKAANIMSHYRIRTVPVVDKKKIIGGVSAKRILKLLSTKDNKWIKANLIFTQKPITVSYNDSLSTARKIMISKRIDHLPVEKKGSINQVLTSYHLLHAINPHEGIGRRSKGMDKVRHLESKIGNIGSTRIPQCTVDDDLNTILNAMLKTNTTCCLVNLWKNLQGIITYRDILSLLAVRMESEIPLYIIGIPEDQKNVNLITSKFVNTLKRIQKVYSEIQEARVSIKQRRSGRKKEGKYEVSIMITTPHHSPHIYKEVGFDLSNVIESLSQKLLRNLSRRSKRRSKTSIRKINLPITSL